MHSIIQMQRKAAVLALGEKIKKLYDEGYTVEADKLLEELYSRMQAWEQDKHLA